MSRSNSHSVDLELEDLEVQLLLAIPRQVRDVLLDPDRAPEVVDRLFPRTHADPTEEAEHRRLLGTSLYRRRLDTLVKFEQTLQGALEEDSTLRLRLDGPTLDLWLHVLNDMRILLGIELDIRDNDWFAHGPSDPSQQVRYHYLAFLSALQESLLQAMGAGGDPPSPPRS